MIDQEFKKGVRLGKRLGETLGDDFKTRPEYVRRQTKITTVPSRGAGSPGDLRNFGSGIATGLSSHKNFAGLHAITEADAKAAVNQAAQNCAGAVPHRRKARSSSATAVLRT